MRCQTDKKAGSQFAIADWIKASKYTDDTVANAAKKAAEEAKKAAETAQTNVTNLDKTVTNNKQSFDNYVNDGYLEPSEIAAMAQDSKRLEDNFAAAEKSYNEVKDSEVLKNTTELQNLVAAFGTFKTAKTELIGYLSDIATRYNAADTNGKAIIVSAVGTKFTNFQSAYSAFYDKLGLANAYITRKIYGDLGVVIGDVTSLAYLKKALMDTPDTEINGGLVLTSLIGLRDTGGNTTAGINGITEKSAKGGGVAAWFGGEMVDKDYNDGSKTPANTIFRFDGSGYVAGGAIWWGTDGRVHADPTSFIISEKNLGAYLTFFEPTWKAGSAGTSVADLVSLKPNAPFSKLGVSGDATFEGAISFHGIKLTYDATNKAIKIDGNLYATGGITAYGASDGAGGGGGFNGSVLSYASAIKLTSAGSNELSQIASAWSVKMLYDAIQNVDVSSQLSSYLKKTDAESTYLTKSAASSTYQPKGNYLTAHQSLDGYVNAITTSGSGNAITSVSKSGKTITFTKSSTFLTSHQSLANYYTKSATDSLLGAKADRASVMTFKNYSLYVNASFESDEISKKASEKYIECWDVVGGWWNWMSGKYIVAGGTSSQFLKADGSVDSNTYSRIGEVLKSIDFTSEDSSFNANNLRKAITFAYKSSKHINTATIGTIVDFCCTNERYSFQLQSSYLLDELYYRRINGDNGIWGDWLRLATINDIPKSLPASDVYAWAKASTKPSYSWSEIGSRPTNVSQFTNDSGYITSSASISGNAGSATKLQTTRSIWGCPFDGTGDINGLFVSGGVHIGYGNEIWCTDNLVINYNNRGSKNVYILNGNLGIGNLSASEKLSVTGNILATGGITAYSSSDIRLKQDLRKLDYFGIIKAMGGTFGFAWKKDGKRSIGWIAQHVLCNPHLKDIVETDEKGYYKINYWSPKLIATAFGAIEQVGDEVSRLKARVVFLESEVQRLSEKQGSSDKKRLDNKNINLLN